MKYINELTLIFILSLAIGMFVKIHADTTIKVMVVDTGLDLSHDSIKKHVKEQWNDNYHDIHGHGTAMTSLILRDVCSQVEIISCRYLNFMVGSIDSTISCFREALKKKVDYVNYSSTGTMNTPEEENILKQLSDQGTTIVTASGNEGINLTTGENECKGSYPACYKIRNLFMVGALNKFGERYITSNYADVSHMRWEKGEQQFVLLPEKKSALWSGTSIAAALYTNSLLLKRCWELNK